VACSSFLPGSSNFVEILRFNHDNLARVDSLVRLPHYYPPSRVRWLSQDKLVTTGDYIRLWSADGQLQRLLRHDANPKGVCTPLTSIDVGDGTIASCDIYGILALWDVQTGVRTAAIDLGQPLADVAFGPNRILAVAGERGDLLVMDPRQPERVDALELREKVCGPARMAWSPSGSGLLAVAWQGEQGGLAVYNGDRRETGQLLQSAALPHGAVADLQWSPSAPDYLCCASEGAGVEVWHVGSDQVRDRPCFSWQPRSGEVSTSLALSSRGQQQLITVGTMPAQPTQGGSVSSLWTAALPEFSQASSQPALASNSPSAATGATIRPSDVARGGPAATGAAIAGAGTGLFSSPGISMSAWQPASNFGGLGVARGSGQAPGGLAF